MALPSTSRTPSSPCVSRSQVNTGVGMKRCQQQRPTLEKHSPCAHKARPVGHRLEQVISFERAKLPPILRKDLLYGLAAVLLDIRAEHRFSFAKQATHADVRHLTQQWRFDLNDVISRVAAAPHTQRPMRHPLPGAGRIHTCSW